jgi:hypothetical protein
MNTIRNKPLLKHYKDIYNDRSAWARRNGVIFTLTFDEFVSIAQVTKYCPIFTNIELSWGFTINGKSSDNSPSLDRINPLLGYTAQNCAIISNKANRIKNNGTAEEHRLIANWQERH